ncbi:MAG: glycosyltransferase family 2 protein [Pseudomonadota bacterium]
MANPKYSIVVPFFNEEGNIDTLLAEILQAAGMLGEAEVVAVDDCSNDATLQKLKTVAAADERVRVVHHLSNSGQSAAICTGVDAAIGQWIITLDGDGQNDPADIPKMVTRIEQSDGLTMVAGHRTKRQDNRLRKFSSRVANGVRGWMLGDGTPDTGCGLKVFARDAFMRFPRFNHMHRFLPALVQRDGGIVISEPVNHRPRTAGVSKYGLWDRLWVGITDIFGVIWLNRRRVYPCAAKELSNGSD